MAKFKLLSENEKRLLDKHFIKKYGKICNCKHPGYGAAKVHSLEECSFILDGVKQVVKDGSFMNVKTGKIW